MVKGKEVRGDCLGRLSKKLSYITMLDERILPHSFQIVGSVVLVKLRKEAIGFKSDIGEALLKLIPNVKTVCWIKGIRGKCRVPEIEIIAGDTNTVTYYKEHGITYKIDVSKLMFSKGNLYERGRIAKLVKPGEVIVDMFCGIGQFTLPIAKSQPSCKVYAIDVNPEAIRFLEENCKINRINNVIPINDDCRNVAHSLKDVADRVIMGYMDGEFIDYALSFLKYEGFIHYHYLSFKKNFDEGIRRLKEASERNCYELLDVTYKRVVKSYAPKVWHVVLDGYLRAKG